MNWDDERLLYAAHFSGSKYVDVSPESIVLSDAEEKRYNALIGMKEFLSRNEDLFLVYKNKDAITDNKEPDDYDKIKTGFYLFVIDVYSQKIKPIGEGEKGCFFTEYVARSNSLSLVKICKKAGVGLRINEMIYNHDDGMYKLIQFGPWGESIEKKIKKLEETLTMESYSTGRKVVRFSFKDCSGMGAMFTNKGVNVNKDLIVDTNILLSRY